MNVFLDVVVAVGAVLRQVHDAKHGRARAQWRDECGRNDQANWTGDCTTRADRNGVFFFGHFECIGLNDTGWVVPTGARIAERLHREDAGAGVMRLRVRGNSVLDARSQGIEGDVRREVDWHQLWLEKSYHYGWSFKYENK